MEHNSTFLLPQFAFEQKGKANEMAIIKGNKYRFTILTNRLIRLEYSEKGLFEDRPSQTFWFRNLEVPKFDVKDKGDTIEINTDYLFLSYKKDEPFSRQSIMIKMSTNNISATGVWRYGFEESGNYHGTYRTLDGKDGKLNLEKGLLSSEGYTVVDDSNSFLLNGGGWIEERIVGNEDLYFFGYNNDFKGCIKDFYMISGQTPMLPRYALGNWWSRYWKYTDEELKDLIMSFEERNIPLSVCMLDMDWHTTEIDKKYGSGWTGYTWNNELFKNPEDFLGWLKSKNIYSSLNLHPALGIRGSEDCYKDVATFMGVDVDNEEPIPFDFTDPKFIQAYFTKVLHPHEDLGCDFWWIDWQQGNNTAVEGLDPLWMLNHFHFLDMARKKEKRPFILSRWPGLGGHRYPIGFSGDTVVSWESLSFQPYFTATAANVGYGWWSHDIGGHFFGNEDPELYTRWVQFGVFSPIMRLHTSKNYYNKREPWRWDTITESIVTEYMQLRHKLIPYLYTMNRRNEETGLTLITPLYYEYPHRGEAYQCHDQYFFGSELMVAPFLNPQIQKLKKSYRKVWMPSGHWFNFFNGEVFDGDTNYPIYGSMDETPVYAKAGAIIPLAKLQNTNQHDNPEVLEVHAFPGANNIFEMYEDDGISLHYKSGVYATTIFNSRYSDKEWSLDISIKGDTSVIPDKRKYEIIFRSIVKDVEIDCSLPYTHSYNKEQKSHSIVIDNVLLQSDITIMIKTKGETLIDRSFDYTKQLMNMFAESTYDTSEKNVIGFVYDSYCKERQGLLAKESSTKEKALEILASDMDNDLKQAALSLLLRSTEGKK